MIYVDVGLDAIYRVPVGFPSLRKRKDIIQTNPHTIVASTVARRDFPTRTNVKESHNIHAAQKGYGKISATPLDPNFLSHFHHRLALHPRLLRHDRTGPVLVQSVEAENEMSLPGVDVGWVCVVVVEAEAEVAAAAVAQTVELHHVAENVG
jgi:hypothetical protein